MRETEELALENLLRVKTFFFFFGAGGLGGGQLDFQHVIQTEFVEVKHCLLAPLLLQLPGRLQQRDANRSRSSDVTAGVRWPLCQFPKNHYK